ncbi:MAG: OmpA family protein [Maricaulaceae bacterium]
MTKKILLAVACAGILNACASTPEPVVEERAVVEAPKPMGPKISSPPVVDERVEVALPTPGSQEDFLYQAGGDSRVYFDYNQYRLSLEAIGRLRMQADWLNRFPQVTAVIEGNADERGTREYNLALAARRADSVKSYLVGQGVSPARLTTVSYGKERPIDGRSSETGWARNRNGNTNLMSGTVG